MNRKLLAVAVAGAVAPMAAQALDVSVSGQVNRAIRFADNGNNSDVQHIDGSASGSRWRFTAEGEVMGGLTAGAHIEQEHASNRGWQADVDMPDAATSQGFRHSYIYFSGDFGKVTLGHTAPAGNGAMWQSHNGAWMGTEYSPDTNSGISVMTTDNMRAYSSYMDLETIGDVLDVLRSIEIEDLEDIVDINDPEALQMALDDLIPKNYYSVATFFPSVNIGRQNTLRYDTPSIGPVSFSGSVQKDGATDHKWSFGANLSHDVGAANVIGGVLFMEDVLGISGGIAFANGTSVNAAWGRDDVGGTDFEDMYINLAHTWGNMSVAIDYRSTDNKKNLEGQAIGLGAQYALGGGVDVYVGFNNYSFDAPNMDLEDVNAFHLGSRVRFN